MADLGIIFLRRSYPIHWYQSLHPHIVGSIPFRFFLGHPVLIISELSFGRLKILWLTDFTQKALQIGLYFQHVPLWEVIVFACNLNKLPTNLHTQVFFLYYYSWKWVGFCASSGRPRQEIIGDPPPPFRHWTNALKLIVVRIMRQIIGGYLERNYVQSDKPKKQTNITLFSKF